MLCLAGRAAAQAADTTYVAAYPWKRMLTVFMADNSIQVQRGNHRYIPNNKMNVGAGYLVHNTVINLRAGVGLIPLRGGRYGSTRSLDLQAHRYGRKLVLDVFFQQYKGYFEQPKGRGEITLHPNVFVRQIGAEGAYLFNSKQFSAKAAFEQSEIQKRSAGSWVLGGGIYYYRIGDDQNALGQSVEERINNLQLGLKGGYVYSWVMDKNWLLTGMGTAGMHVGNSPELLKKGQVQVYPTALGRFAVSYHKEGWGLSLLSLIHNNVVYPTQDNRLKLTSVNLQASYVKHF
jgi:hypothetical protein